MLKTSLWITFAACVKWFHITPESNIFPTYKLRPDLQGLYDSGDAAIQFATGTGTSVAPGYYP